MYKLLLALLLLLCGCREQIVHNLNESEANRLVTRLASASITAERVRQPDSSWALSVKSSDALSALRYLEGSRAFHGRRKKPQQGAQFIPSKSRERFEGERALSAEIEITLRSLASVLDAHVHLNMPESERGIGKRRAETERGSASVLLIVSEGFDSAESQIAKLVGGAAGISEGHISVLVQIWKRPLEGVGPRTDLESHNLSLPHLNSWFRKLWKNVYGESRERYHSVHNDETSHAHNK